MRNEPAESNDSSAGDAVRRPQLVNVLPWAWLVLSAAWAVVIFVTDRVGWPLAVWIAATVGPLTVLKTRHDPNTDPEGVTR